MKPFDLYTEIQDRKRALEPEIETYDTLISRYASTCDQHEPENSGFNWVTNVLSQLMYYDPVWIVDSQKGGRSAAYAVARKKALDRWTQDQELGRFLREGPVLDAQFLRGVAVMSREPQKRGYRFGDDSMVPTMNRVSPRDYIEDGTATNHDKALWKAHRVVCMREELLARAKEHPEEKWNVELIEKAQSSTSEMSQMDAQKRGSVTRDEIVYWQVWMRRHPDFDGPVLADIIESAGGIDVDAVGYDWLREPREWYGPDWGPYYHFECLPVSDRAYGVAPLYANKGQSDDLNACARAVIEAENAFKQFVVIDEMTMMNPDGKTKKQVGKKLAEVIQNARNRYVYTAPSFDQSKAKEMKIGGAPQEMYAALQVRMERHDRSIGLSQARQGNTSSGQTATSDVIADTAADRKVGLIRVAIHDALKRVGHGFLWYLEHDSELAVLVGTDPEMGEIWVSGGSFTDDDEKGNYDCKIEPMSTELTTPAVLQAQATMLMNFFGTFAPIMPQTPFIDWARLTQVVGNAWNIPYMGELVRPDILAAVSQVQMAQSLAEGESVKQKPESVKSVPSGGGAPKIGAPTARPAQPAGGLTKAATSGSGGKP